MIGRDDAIAPTRPASMTMPASTALARASSRARTEDVVAAAHLPVRQTAARAAPYAGSGLAPLRIAIERLTLDGRALSPLERRQLLPAIEGELTRLQRTVRQESVPVAGARDRVSAPALTAAASGSVLALGVDIARSLHAGLRERETLP